MDEIYGLFCIQGNEKLLFIKKNEIKDRFKINVFKKERNKRSI